MDIIDVIGEVTSEGMRLIQALQAADREQMAKAIVALRENLDQIEESFGLDTDDGGVSSPMTMARYRRRRW